MQTTQSSAVAAPTSLAATHTAVGKPSASAPAFLRSPPLPRRLLSLLSLPPHPFPGVISPNVVVAAPPEHANRAAPLLSVACAAL